MMNTSIDTRLVENIRHRMCRLISNSQTAAASINAVYVFGSALNKKKFKKNSDIDIAFLLNNSLYKKDPLNASKDSYLISTEIGLSLERQTDVIILNAASIETIYQIISTGMVIYEKNTEQRIDYEIAAKGMYFDFKPFLDTLRSKTISKPTKI